MELIKISKPVVVEGKYDKIKLSSVIDARIITTEGFGIFNESKKKDFIVKLAEKDGIIVLTDSDGAGLVIRNYFNSILPKDKLTHLYTPEVYGKEKRKKIPSKSGLLGVEGIDVKILRELFAPLASDYAPPSGRTVTKLDFFEDGLSGGGGSSEKRKRLAESIGAPTTISANALVDFINYLYTYDEYKELLKGL